MSTSVLWVINVFNAVFVVAYDATTVTVFVASFDVAFVTCLMLY